MATKKKPNRPRPKPGPRPAAGTGAGPGGGPATRPAAAKAKERTGPTRAERLAAAEAARRRKATRTRALISVAAVALAALLVVTIVASRRSNNRTVSRLEASGACKYDTKSDTDAGPGNNHVNGDVTYSVDPPAGGNHNPTPANPGVYTMDNKPPDAQIVHSLEHGYVVLWYRPDVTPAMLTDLTNLANRYDRDVLLVPRPSMSKPVAATAWHHRLLCSQDDLTALERFITTYRNQGPERIPH